VVEATLSALGIDGVVIDDETEFQDFLENNHQYWDYVDEDLEKAMAGKSRLTFYLEANDEGFAKMGEVFSRCFCGIEQPRVGLMSVGREEGKGTALIREAYAKLRELPMNFVGNLEGGDLVSGYADVIVSDGFSGNILLKSVEGIGKMMFGSIKSALKSSLGAKIGALLVKKPLRGMKKQLDPNEYGGAPLLGIAHPVIKAHGSSNAKAFKNAIRQAISYASSTTINDVTVTMAAVAEQKKAELKKAIKEDDELTPSPYPRLK
jgi:fatty acid/phospholipid biosynthesis enzyme